MVSKRAKRASYRAGISWIADNDEPCECDTDIVEGFISTLLLADLFNKDPRDVAKAIVDLRISSTVRKQDTNTST